jgi:hypothetical protein
MNSTAAFDLLVGQRPVLAPGALAFTSVHRDRRRLLDAISAW